ncbi:MAG: Trk system potassium transporter TrkA [Planctomycetota bacterium]|jgi:trk system potassium uptake protein TrkA
MKILIVGAGAVGFNLAKQLSGEGHTISVIENDPQIYRKITEELDVFCVDGNGNSPSVLEDAGIKEVDMVLAVTDSDEANLTVCLFAYWYGVDCKIARLRNEDLTKSNSVLRQNQFFIDRMINPIPITVDTIMKAMETPGAIYVSDFAESDILFRGFRVPSDAPIAGRKIQELKEAGATDSFLIVAIQRGDDMIIPTAEMEICPEDNIFVLVARASLPYFLPMVNKRAVETQGVIIYGATRIGLRLARALEDTAQNVILIEPDEDKAEIAASKLATATVLRGQATETEILKQATIEPVDFFVGASENEQENILACLLAKAQYSKKTVVITHEPDYVPVFSSIGIDVVINPRLITVSSILQHITRGPILGVAKLFDKTEAEATEMIVESGSKIIGKELSDIAFPKGSILGTIIKNGSMILPYGDYVLSPGDRAIVFYIPEAREKVQALFTKK